LGATHGSSSSSYYRQEDRDDPSRHDQEEAPEAPLVLDHSPSPFPWLPLLAHFLFHLACFVQAVHAEVEIWPQLMPILSATARTGQPRTAPSLKRLGQLDLSHPLPLRLLFSPLSFFPASFPLQTIGNPSSKSSPSKRPDCSTRVEKFNRATYFQFPHPQGAIAPQFGQ